MISFSKHRIKEIIANNKWLEPFARRLINGKLFNRIKYKIGGTNNRVSYGNSIIDLVLFDIKGSNNSIIIKDGCLLHNVQFMIRGSNHNIIIDKECKFTRGSSIWMEDNHCMLKIGQRSSFEIVHLAVTEPYSKIEIGEDCMFAYDIDVRTGDSHSIICSKTSQRTNWAQNIKIGNHVWVAAHCIILKGANIADNSVVATGSVVTKPISEENVIIAGNPARVVKRDINWARERIPR